MNEQPPRPTASPDLPAPPARAPLAARVTPEPGERPPRRLLERAPGERLAARAAAAAPTGPTGSARSAVLLGLLGGGIGLAAHLAGTLLLLLVWPLVVVAAMAGFLVGSLVRVGGGDGTGGLTPATRRTLAVGISVVAVVAGLMVTWAASGRYLGPFDFVDQVYGLAAPLQVAAAALGGLAGSR